MNPRLHVHLTILCGFLLIGWCTGVQVFKVTPPYEDSTRSVWRSYRQAVVSALAETSISPSKCGIIWTLATVTGSIADLQHSSQYEYDNSIGYNRLMSVVFEVLQSGARAKHAIQLNSSVPTFCQEKPSLVLYTDRTLFHSNISISSTLLASARCIFDSIVYFDQLPLHSLPVSVSGDVKDASKRLSSRTNILKLVALFSTPFEYSLYLDGDTAPCHSFPYDPYEQLNKHDIFTTKNPFGFQSTNQKPLYKDAPNHPQYASFPEPNGGVIGFRWTAQTERWLLRSLELIPFFRTLGFDQDQIFMRHALFEEMHLHGLNVNYQSMDRYCRAPWNCDRNRCATGCVIIHQRKCLINGIDYKYIVDSADASTCHSVARNVGYHLFHFTRKYRSNTKKSKQIPKTSKKTKQKSGLV